MLEQWIIAMAVLLTLFHPELTESSSNCCLDKGSKRQIIRVDKNATAFVSCPELAEDEKLYPSIPISLHKGDTKLHSDMINNTHQSWQTLQVSKQNSTLSYKIVRTKANDTGLYCCTIHTDMRTSQTILLIKDAQQPKEPSPPCPTEQTLPLTIGIGAIILYNLFITVFSCYLARKLKKTEPPENPYMNTRPRGFRRR